MRRLATAAVLLAVALLATAGGAAEKKKVVLIGQKPDHPYRTHTYLPDCELLAKCLRQTGGVEAVVSRGWPEDPKVLEGVDTVVVHTRLGGDVIFHPTHRDEAAKLFDSGVGLVAIHWGTGSADPAVADRWLKTLGGHFNAEGNGFSRYKIEKSAMRVATPEHPISRGWNDFDCRDEYYYDLKFMDKAVPVALAKVSGKDYPIAWAYERPDGKGRAFGCVAAHFHDNFALDPFRQLFVNGILWTAGVEIPQGGAPAKIEARDLDLPEEFERLKK